MAFKALKIFLSISFLVLIWNSIPKTTAKEAGSTLQTNEDIAEIEFEIKNKYLNRPNLFDPSSTLIQNVHFNDGFTTYSWFSSSTTNDADDSSRTHTNTRSPQVVLKRHGLEYDKKVIIFKSGFNDNQFGPAMKRTYIVLRKVEKKPSMYHVNLVYVWNIGESEDSTIEWSTFDEIDYTTLQMSSMERNMCRNDDCDFPEYIFGTCNFVSTDCSAEQVLAAENHDDKEDAFKELMMPVNPSEGFPTNYYKVLEAKMARKNTNDDNSMFGSQIGALSAAGGKRSKNSGVDKSNEEQNVKLPTNYYKAMESQFFESKNNQKGMVAAGASKNGLSSGAPTGDDDDEGILSLTGGKRGKKNTGGIGDNKETNAQIPTNYYKAMESQFFENQNKQKGMATARASGIQTGDDIDVDDDMDMKHKGRIHKRDTQSSKQIQLQNGSTELEFKNDIPEAKKRLALATTTPNENKKVESKHENAVELTKCHDCESIGEFYKDFEESAEVSKKIGLYLQKQFKHMDNQNQNPNQDEEEQATNPMKAINGPFTGYGDCDESELIILSNPALASVQHPASKQLDDVIEFYLETLRLNCQSEFNDELRSWLTSNLNFFHVQNDLVLGLVPSSSLIKFNLLTKEEQDILFSALITSLYTINYIETSNHVTTNPMNNPTISSPQQATSFSTNFLKRLILKALNYIQKQIPQHFIKLTRSILQLLQDKFYSLLIERIGLKQIIFTTSNANSTMMKMSLNNNDLQLVMGLKEFIMFGMEPSLKSGISNFDSFTSFYTMNQGRAKYFVDAYDI